MNSATAEGINTTQFNKELERFDNVNQINYLALYVAIISPLPLSVEKAFDIVSGRDVIPTERAVTPAYLARIQRYFKESRRNMDKAERLFKVNKYKLKAYLKGSLKPSLSEIKPIRTLSEYYKKVN